MNTYKVKQEDLIGELKGFPIEVVQAMVDEQVRQGNRAYVSVFQSYVNADKDEKGFTWADSKEGIEFWEDVITRNFFNKFFEKYPRTLGKAFEDHFQNTPKEVIKENWEKSKEKYACQMEEDVVIEDESEEDAFYKYYVSGMNNADGKVNISLLEEKGGRNTYLYSGCVESAIYYISQKDNMKILKCDNINIGLLEEAGYVELTYKPETVEYNGKKYIKSEFERAINHLTEVEE